MKCKHWKKIPSCCVGDLVCAFNLNGDFDSDNWNCYLMNQLRDIAEENKVWSDDQYCSIIPYGEGGRFAVLYWYKSRGKTEKFWIIGWDENQHTMIRKGTEFDALEIVNEHVKRDDL
uniref:Uncharacterized protein n=1 Tax=viral metagenome TaxID=1070528 RepID=A0A6M3X6K6_9ZZZZ